MEMLSPKQLETIANFNNHRYIIHYGPFGCGKSYAINLGAGFKCLNCPPMNNDSVIAIIGRTVQSAKRNICNSLTSLFGDNFVITKSKKDDGYEKDALLFGHKCFILGANDKKSEERIRGMNCYLILGDEVSLWPEEIFKLIMGRLRGPAPEGWGKKAFIGCTNPGSPKNYLKKLMDSYTGEEADDDVVHFEGWKSTDIITKDAESYYNSLKALYKNNTALLKRYVYGEWAAADGLVYPEFDETFHVIPQQELKGAIYTKFYIGLDFGAEHPTAAVLIGVMPKGEHIVLEEIKESNLLIKDLIKKLVDLIGVNTELLQGIYVDPSAKAIRNELYSAGFGNLIKKAINDVDDGISYVKQLLNSGNLFISSNCTQIIDEFYIYQYKEGIETEKAQVVKVNDDLMDALRYGVYSPTIKNKI